MSAHTGRDNLLAGSHEDAPSQQNGQSRQSEVLPGLILSKDLSALIDQIKAKWSSHDHPPSTLLVCHNLDGEYRVVISETSTMYRTIDQHDQVMMIEKPKSESTLEVVSCGTEIIPVERRYGNERDAFVSDEIAPIVYGK